jgi:hypothetical protein
VTDTLPHCPLACVDTACSSTPTHKLETGKGKGKGGSKGTDADGTLQYDEPEYDMHFSPERPPPTQADVFEQVQLQTLPLAVAVAPSLALCGLEGGGVRVVLEC